ncbi:hypothetical protein N7491_009537 [Penicillium cf. griseofulvum]|uniref:Carbonic anhydrase n=1 Tax=Penicillium cf. griseofulvum TaxID=2972120 RepID=A0A9W9JSJ5_9EURO|nr:hypothetical protein N7472_004869 [Penicillium cf. griseofulvum]KAJ5424321.1 hypothetical protein N7491_009537 [Penicillium cf. griseofulvum]KAJ5442437.1 hypothetical protein N7445_005444 [Penicillium cf. griseofulvum]
MIDTRLQRAPLKPDSILDLQQATQHILWIGCCDSNAKESTVLNILSEEIFVLRNLGNMIINGDLSCETTVKHAVVDLQVKHIVVCGHYGCRIVNTTSRDGLKGPWSSKLNVLHSVHEEDLNQLPVRERDRFFVELNVLDQIRSLRQLSEVTDAITLGRLHIHGLVYDSETEKACRVLERHQNH